VNTETKKENYMLPTVRVSEDVKNKLMALCERSGKSQSSVMRELIIKGTIDVIIDGKTLMRDLAEFRRDLNKYSHTMFEQIQDARNDLQQIYSCLQARGTKNGELDLYLAKASLRLDEIQKTYKERIRSCEANLITRSDSYGHF
jgi:hypothetical protein